MPPHPTIKKNYNKQKAKGQGHQSTLFKYETHTQS